MLCTNSLKPWWMLSGTVELHVGAEQVPRSPSYVSQLARHTGHPRLTGRSFILQVFGRNLKCYRNRSRGSDYNSSHGGH